MNTLVQCDNCSGYCPTNYSESRVTTTTYGGRLCGTGCALKWIGKHQVKEESNGSRLRKLVSAVKYKVSSCDTSKKITLP